MVTAPYTNESDRPALTLRRGSDAQNASILRPHRLSTGVQPPALPQLLVQAPDDDGEEEEEELVKESAKRKTPSGEKIFIEVAHLEEGDVFVSVVCFIEFITSIHEHRISEMHSCILLL